MNIIDGLGGKNGYGNPAVDNRGAGKSPAADKKNSTTESTSEGTGVNLSSSAAAMKQLPQTLASSPSFDQTKVDQIKTMIANGQYSIDPHKIAQKFMEMESNGS